MLLTFMSCIERTVGTAFSRSHFKLQHTVYISMLENDIQCYFLDLNAVPDRGSSVGAIAGGTVGAVFGLGVIAGALLGVWWCYKIKKGMEGKIYTVKTVVCCAHQIRCAGHVSIRTLFLVCNAHLLAESAKHTL